MPGSRRKPLAGIKILVTRARHQAKEFSQLLRGLGAKPVEFPLIEIRPLESPRLNRFIERFCESELTYDCVIFTSSNGVNAFFRFAGRNSTAARALRRSEVVAIGPRTALSLKRRGVRVRVVPKKYVAESLVDELGAGNIKGRRFLILTAKGARDVLPRRLRDAGATVAVRTLYETVPVSGGAGKLRQLLRELDFITVASGSTVHSLVRMVAGGSRIPSGKLPGKARLASIGPVTSRAARRHGLKVDIEAAEYTMSGLAKALVDYVQKDK